MDIFWIILILVVLVAPPVAWGLYKTGFKVKKITVKTGPVEAEMERETSKTTPSTSPHSSSTVVKQTAADGGKIEGSGISAPAKSGARIEQKSTGEDSRIDDSPIHLN